MTVNRGYSWLLFKVTPKVPAEHQVQFKWPMDRRWAAVGCCSASLNQSKIKRLMATDLPSPAAVYDTNITHSLRANVSFAIKAHGVSGSILSRDN